ncbi:MAG: glycosyltransferase family 4 protein [Gammaproteobacteria bacterium]|jgi:glycosyltransferase involved in cell wall biosynthesis|nr:glycosyltransferase family 4 protein [Gammaproteobacteria bacterium]MBU1465002.1 glycosyltransferase family 4 protein [Gammaproteobacteria bacterium]MBU2020913.1 glycosyltransferase family 4 protein [Gammaproteobacteria bacterium]MBU2240166.1 glycosyltransferase family 4 protein [Gammaproteobacteria bacterium]MBU2317875.1 glycosyltransferase family 4 protein [Gammaproteobacteria bacterium]
MLTVLHVNLAKGFRGGERQTELLIRALAKHFKIKQLLACREDSPLRTRLADVEDLSFVTANNQLSGHYAAPHADIVHAHEAKAVHWAYIHKLLRNTPYILTRRVDTVVKDKWLNKKTYSNASALVGISTLIANQIRDKRWGEVNQIPSTLAHLETDHKEGEAFRNAFPGKTIIGHVGALVDKHKGQKVLIEAASLLEKSHPDLHIVFFGDGADKEELESLSKDIKNITWMGFKPKIGDYLPYFDLFAFPSRNEGLGSTLLDVMDAGVPIIASNVGGIPDIVIDNETGILIEANDSSALKDAIIKLSSDKALQTRLVEGAKKQIENYTPQKMAERYFSIYEKITA